VDYRVTSDTAQLGSSKNPVRVVKGPFKADNGAFSSPHGAIDHIICFPDGPFCGSWPAVEAVSVTPMK
jgi:hypothetical protein